MFKPTIDGLELEQPCAVAILSFLIELHAAKTLLLGNAPFRSLLRGDEGDNNIYR
jgi:hypothetical protein